MTEDKHVDRVYEYLSRVREKSHEEIGREIRKIKGVFKLLCDLSESTFPVDNALGFLFLDPEALPIPISIARLKDHLPDVLDRTETILWMFRSLQEIAELRRPEMQLPDEWNERTIERATSRIAEIVHLIGLRYSRDIDACSFYVKLVEEGTNWSEKTSDRELAAELSDQLNLLWGIVYGEEEVEYATREEQFYAEESTKAFRVKCDKCGDQLELEADYQGVVEVNEREMGKEVCHQWSMETSCTSCGETLEIIYELWEYPEWVFNYEDTECFGCKLVSEEPTEPPTTTLADFFSEENRKVVN